MTSTEGVILFPTGTTARVVQATAETAGEELLGRLRLPPPTGTLVLNGSTAPVNGDLKDRLRVAIEQGVAKVAVADRLTVLTGATDAGIFSLLGAAMHGRSAPLVGVAPDRLVTWPGRRLTSRRRVNRNTEPLEPHHSHFVLVEGDDWGDETKTLLVLADALEARAPSLAVLCGGGRVARKEALGHSRAGRSLVVLAGSGRLADELAAAVEAGDAEDPLLAEIVTRGNVTVCGIGSGPAAVATALRAALK